MSAKIEPKRQVIIAVYHCPFRLPAGVRLDMNKLGHGTEIGGWWIKHGTLNVKQEDGTLKSYEQDFTDFKLPNDVQTEDAELDDEDVVCSGCMSVKNMCDEDYDFVQCSKCPGDDTDLCLKCAVRGPKSESEGDDTYYCKGCATAPAQPASE